MIYKEMKKKIVLNILPTTIIGTIIITAPLTTALIFTKIVGESNKLFNFLTKEIIKQEIEKLYPAKNILPHEAIKNQTKTKFTIKSVDIEFKPQGDDAIGKINYEITKINKDKIVHQNPNIFNDELTGYLTQEKKEILVKEVEGLTKNQIYKVINAKFESSKKTHTASQAKTSVNINKVIINGINVIFNTTADDANEKIIYNITRIYKESVERDKTTLQELDGEITGFQTQTTNNDKTIVEAVKADDIKLAIETLFNPHKNKTATQARQVVIPGPDDTIGQFDLGKDNITYKFKVVDTVDANKEIKYEVTEVKKGNQIKDDLTNFKGTIVGFQTQKEIDLVTVNAIDKAKIKTAIEATYSNKAANLPSATNDDPSVIVDGAIVTYTVINDDNAGEKTYTIQSIVLNGTSSNQSLGPLGDKIVGFKTQAKADLETVNAIDKAKMKAEIEATYSNKAANLPSATNDDPFVIVDGAIVTYTVINDDNVGEKTYTIQSIVLNGIPSTQSLGPLGDKIVGFKTQATADLETVNAIDKAKIKTAIEATYSNKGTNLPSATNDDPSVIVDGATVTYTVINNDNAGEKTYTIQSIVLNGTSSTQSLGPLSDKIVGFKTQTTADLETVNAIDKAKIKTAIEATYSNKGTNLPSATNDDPSVIVDGATVTYTVIDNDNAGEKTYTIQSIILNGISSTQSLGPLGDKIIDFKTQATADLETVNAIDKAKIKTAIEATYSNKGTNLPSATNDDPSVIVDGATVTYTVIDNDNVGEKTYTIQSIVLNGTSSNQSLGPLGDKIVGFKTQATADLETVNAIDKAKIKNAIEATYSNKGTNLPSATNDDPSIIVDGAIVTYTVINDDNAGEKTYTIQSIVLNGTSSNQSLGPLGDKIVGFKTQATADLETVNAIDKAKIKTAIEATYSNKGTNLPSATNDDPSVIVDGATVTYIVIDNDNDGEKTYTIQSIILNGTSSNQSLGLLGDKIVGFKTQALVDLETINAIDKVKIKTAIEATYSNKGTNLPSATNDDPSVIVDGATVTYTVIDNDNAGEKTYTIQSIVLNGIPSTQSLGPLGDKIVGFKTQTTADLETVNAIDKAKIKNAIEATYSNKAANLPSATNDDPSVIVDGAIVTYTVINDDNAGEKTYTIQSIVLNGIPSTQSLGLLGDKIVGFKTQATADLETVNAIDKAKIQTAIEATYPNKGTNLPSATNDDPSVIVDGGTVTYTVIDNDNAGEKTYTIQSIVLNGIPSTQSLGLLGDKIVGFKTQATADLETVNAIDKAKIKTAIEATYPNKGTNLPSATNDDPSVIVDGAIVTYTVINDDNAGEKTYTIQSIVLNGTSSNQSLGPLGDKIIGFKTQATADLETVNAIDKAKIKTAIEATYPNKGTNLPSATNDDPSVIVDGATVTYTVINDDNAGEKTYTIQFIVLNGIPSTQSLGLLGDKIVGFKTQATADLETVNAIDKAKIKNAIEATYSNKGTNLPSATNDDPSIIVDGAIVTYTVINDDNAGEKTYTIQSIVLNGTSSNQSLGPLGDKIVGFKTQATADLETVNAIDKAKIKTAIEATYSNKGTNLPSATNDDPSVIVDGATVTYTVINDDNVGEKTYTIQSIVLNGTSSNQSLGPLGDKIVGFKTQATADLETVNAIDKAKIKTAIEATYPNKGTNLPSATNDDPSVIVDGATVTYTVINNDNAGEKTYTIQFIVLNGIPSTQSLGLLGDKIVGFKTQATADLETVNAIDKAKIKTAIEATYSNKGTNLPSATNDDPSVIVDGAIVTYIVIDNDNAGEKTYTIQSIILNGISSTQSLGPLGDKIVGFKTQALVDLETINAIDKAKIKTAIEATYSNKGTNLPSATNDDPSIIVDGATVTYTVINDDNAGEKTYTIQFIVLNGIPSTQSLGLLGDKIVGFKTQATADLETVNAIDKAKIKTAIEATYSNKGTNLPSATNDDPSVIVDGATVTYTVIDNDNAGEKTYTIQSIILNGTSSTQSLGPLGDKIVGFMNKEQYLLKTITKADINYHFNAEFYAGKRIGVFPSEAIRLLLASMAKFKRDYLEIQVGTGTNRGIVQVYFQATADDPAKEVNYHITKLAVGTEVKIIQANDNTYDGVITGFGTVEEYTINVVKASIEAFAADLDNDVYKLGVGKIIGGRVFTLPSAYKAILDADGQTEWVINVPFNGLEATYKIEADDANGLIKYITTKTVDQNGTITTDPATLANLSGNLTNFMSTSDIINRIRDIHDEIFEATNLGLYKEIFKELDNVGTQQADGSNSSIKNLGATKPSWITMSNLKFDITQAQSGFWKGIEAQVESITPVNIVYSYDDTGYFAYNLLIKLKGQPAYPANRFYVLYNQTLQKS